MKTLILTLAFAALSLNLHAQGFAGVVQVESTPSSSTPTVTVAGQLLGALKHPSSDVQQADASFLTPSKTSGPSKPFTPLPARIRTASAPLSPTLRTTSAPQPRGELPLISPSAPIPVFRQKISLSGPNTFVFQPVGTPESPQAQSEALAALPLVSQSIAIPLKSLEIMPLKPPASGLELPAATPTPNFALPKLGNSL